MRYCEKCGYVMDEFSHSRDKQNCPICSGVWSEDDMTAIEYAKLSEEEKDAYDEQLLDQIKNSPNFDEHSFCLNGNSKQDGGFWAGFRVDKWKRLSLQNSDILECDIDETIEARKNREPFKPFPKIDTVKAREIALDAEITHKAIERGYYNQNTNEQANVPKCPICQSTNLSKISTVKKAVGGALFGLFSSDVRKTMHCKNCGFKW